MTRAAFVNSVCDWLLTAEARKETGMSEHKFVVAALIRQFGGP
jgi:hypothetical protein